MLDGKKIIYVSIIDTKGKSVEDLRIRIWKHEKLIKSILKENSVLIGRKTWDLTKWSGEKTWILTRNKDLLHKKGIGLIHDIDDIHLHIEGDLYILGGISLFSQFESYVDEMHLFVLNDIKGNEDWINCNMRKWNAKNYHRELDWSYALLYKSNLN
jgi:dihydrofolate reductase